MSGYQFRQMASRDVQPFLKEMFGILYENMTAIAPTGDTFEEDYRVWSEAVLPFWENNEACKTVLIFREDALCGYFQYGLLDGILKMDEL